MRISDCSSDVCSSDLNGASLDVNWNQHGVHVQAYAVLKKAKNLENAQRLVDYCLSDKVQSKFSSLWNSGPVTEATYKALTPEEIGRASCRERVCKYV